MARKKDITSFLDKEQRQLLKGLRVQVKELADILKLVAASQDVDAVRKEHMQFLGTVGSRTLTPHELKLAKEGISLDELRKICGARSWHRSKAVRSAIRLHMATCYEWCMPNMT